MAWFAICCAMSALMLAVWMMTRWFQRKRRRDLALGVLLAVLSFFLGLWTAVEIMLTG